MAIGLFDLAEKRMAWADRRQQVLAQNIANVNTPHWQAHDLTPFAAVLANTGAPALARTQTGHMGSVEGVLSGQLTTDRPTEKAPDGNTVALDEQLTKVADTDATQALVINLYKKYTGMFRLALGRGP